ncbi:MAG: phosphoribosylglycinamide formyltransferase [Lewinellaceae bacterium]|nr:phosphoribosylglycinamide formyltransferase [Lewinellaceae bacterium]
MVRIAIFASGGGSNAKKIIEHFQGSELATVALVVSNRQQAGVLGIAETFGIPVHVLNRSTFYETETVLQVMADQSIDLVVLAGFLLLVPEYLIKAYLEHILNIHPALLPKYGGKGMYGMHVHEAVKAAGETESGITIHRVNEQYDKGEHLFQAHCTLDPADTPEDIAHKVLELEHQYYPLVVEQVARTIASETT